MGELVTNQPAGTPLWKTVLAARGLNILFPRRIASEFVSEHSGDSGVVRRASFKYWVERYSDKAVNDSRWYRSTAQPLNRSIAFLQHPYTIRTDILPPSEQFSGFHTHKEL